MSFANPWGLLGLLALPVIVAIHLYHRRFPRLEIAGLHLWGAETDVRSPGRRPERLPITASLLLELLAALLLSLLLAQPRFGEENTVPHVIAVLDNSASMSARPADGASFRERAVELLRERVEDLERGSVVTLILTGRRPVMLAGPAIPWDEARDALENWQPSLPRHDFRPAWDLAAQLAGESGRLLFVTDRLPDDATPVPESLETISVGRPLDNVAIIAARWSFDAERNTGRIYLRIGNLGREQTQATIRGRANEQTIFSRTVTLPAKGEKPLQAEVPGGLARLAVDVQAAGDGLELDNTVTLIEPKVRLVNVALTLPEDDPARRPLRRVLDVMPELQFTDPDAADLLIGPAGQLPPSRPGLWWLGVGPLDRSEKAREEAKAMAGPYVLEQRNPLLDGITLDGIIWSGVQPIDFAVTPLVSAGAHPLLARLDGTRTRAYLLNADLARSNLTESPDWPILLNNFVELRRQNLPGLRRWNYRLNEDIRFRLTEGEPDDSARELTLRHQGRERPLARSAVVEVPPLEEPGVYEIRDEEKLVGRFAVNFHDRDESRLTRLGEGRREPAKTARAAQIALDDPHSWIILLGILLLLIVVFLDWKVLRPRRQTGTSAGG